MNDNELMWATLNEKMLLSTPVFDVMERNERSETGIAGRYIAMNAPKWVTIIPVIDDDFVLVRQYRHGLGAITSEFPGGVADNAEEEVIVTAARELEEETGFRAGKLTILGTCNPNPALFTNTFTVCLAEELEQTNEQHLDDDEVLTYKRVPKDEVIDSFCKGEYVHAFMGTALALYMRHEMNNNN